MSGWWHRFSDLLISSKNGCGTGRLRHLGTQVNGGVEVVRGAREGVKQPPHRGSRSASWPAWAAKPPSTRHTFPQWDAILKHVEGSACCLQVKPGGITRLAVHHRLQFLGKRGLSHPHRRRPNLYIKHTAKALATCGVEWVDGAVNAGVGEWTGGCMDEQTTKLYSLPQF